MASPQPADQSPPLERLENQSPPPTAAEDTSVPGTPADRELPANFTVRDKTTAYPAKLFIGGLSWETNNRSLEKYFSQFGEVVEHLVMRDMHTGHSRGFAFIRFADPAVLDTIFNQEHIIDGKKVEPKIAVPSTKSSTDLTQPKFDNTNRIYVRNLPENLTESAFADYFKQFGDVVRSNLLHDRHTGKLRGSGFVTFADERGYFQALDAPNPQIDGHPLAIQKAFNTKRRQWLPNDGSDQFWPPGDGAGRGMPPLRGRGGRGGAGGFGRGRGRRPAWPARYPPMGNEYVARPQIAAAPNPYGYMGNYPYEEEYDPAAFGIQMMGYPGVFYPRPYAAGHYPGFGQRASVDATGSGASVSTAGMAPSHMYAGWYGGSMNPASGANPGSSGNAVEPTMLSPTARVNPAPMYNGVPLPGAFGRVQAYNQYRPFKAPSSGPTADPAYPGLGEGSFDEHGAYLTMPAGSTVSSGDGGRPPAPGGGNGGP